MTDLERAALLVEQRGSNYVKKWFSESLDNNVDNNVEAEIENHAKAYAWEALQHAVAIRALPAQSSGQWVSVPREPTDRMLMAGGEVTAWDSNMTGEHIDDTVRDIYKAMLAASPPPAPTAGNSPPSVTEIIDMQNQIREPAAPVSPAQGGGEIIASNAEAWASGKLRTAEVAPFNPDKIFGAMPDIDPQQRVAAGQTNTLPELPDDPFPEDWRDYAEKLRQHVARSQSDLAYAVSRNAEEIDADREMTKALAEAPLLERIERLQDALDAATQGKYSELMLELARERGEQIAKGVRVGELKGEVERLQGELADKESDRQYHMNAINRLARFLAFHGTSDDVIDAATDNMKRFTRELAIVREHNRKQMEQINTLEGEVQAADARIDRCKTCNAELSQCGPPNEDGEPVLDCRECQLLGRAEAAERTVEQLREELAAANIALGTLKADYIKQGWALSAAERIAEEKDMLLSAALAGGGKT